MSDGHKKFDRRSFSGVVSVVQKGKPLFQNAFGYADLPNKIPNEQDTKFPTASAGKAFVAVGIMKSSSVISKNRKEKIMYDIIIIGGGVIGCAIARELSRYELKTIILEKSNDVGNATSKANSGIVHGAYAAHHGTLKAELCAKGNPSFQQLEDELNFGYRKTGGFVLSFEESDLKKIEALKENGIKNGSNRTRILDRNQILNMEPAINPEVKYALYDPDIGLVSPYEYTIALAENAIDNGVELMLKTKVKEIKPEGDFFSVITDNKIFKGKRVINAAGVYSDKVAEMVGAANFKIKPRRGQYIIFEKDSGKLFKNVIFQLPTEKGKGVLVTSTYHGNLMIGPDSQEIFNREDKSTDLETLKYIIETAQLSVPGILNNNIIRSFSGIRATPDTGDFIIEESSVKNFINVGGIESPGLTSSPAIARKVLEILKQTRMSFIEKDRFNPRRKGIIVKKDLTVEEVNRRIKLESCPEKIICRCERVSEGEIVDALNRNIDISSVDAVKRRTRAGMGLCQGNFCGPRVRELIAREKKIPQEAITNSPGSVDNFDRVKNFYELVKKRK